MSNSDKLRDVIQLQNSEIERYAEEIRSLKNRLKEEEIKSSKSEGLLKLELTKKRQLLSEVESQKQIASAQKNKIKAYLEANSNLANKLNQTENSTQALRDQITKVNDFKGRYEAQLKEREDQIAQLKTELESRTKLKNNELKQLIKSNQAFAQENERLKTEVNQLKLSLSTLSFKLEESEALLARIEAEFGEGNAKKPAELRI